MIFTTQSGTPTRLQAGDEIHFLQEPGELDLVRSVRFVRNGQPLLVHGKDKVTSGFLRGPIGFESFAPLLAATHQLLVTFPYNNAGMGRPVRMVAILKQPGPT